MSSYYKSRIVYPGRKQEARKRRADFILAFFGIGAFVGLVAWGVYLFAQLEKFRIKNIAVEGTRVLAQEEIRAFVLRALDGSVAFVVPRNNLFAASSRHIAEALQTEFPRIRTISIKKSFPDGMKIFVAERTEWGVFCKSTTNNQQPTTNNELRGVATSSILIDNKESSQRVCGYIDRDGVLFEYPMEISGSLLPVISDDSLAEIREGGAAVSRDTVSFFEEAQDGMRRDTGVALSGLDILKDLPDDYRLRTREGWYAFVPRADAVMLWLNPLKALLEHELVDRSGLEYIDARFGNKLFYKKK